MTRGLRDPLVAVLALLAIVVAVPVLYLVFVLVGEGLVTVVRWFVFRR